MKEEDLLKNIDFSDDNYTVKQNLVRNKYTVRNSKGEKILGAKQKMFKMKEEFPFTDPDGNVVFRIKAKRRLDIAGDYGIIDEATGETIAVLTKEFSILTHNWKIKDPETDGLIASIESRGKVMGLLRSLVDLAQFIPHKYTIYSADRDEIGKIQGKWSLKDKYEVELGELGNIPREAVIAAAVTVDALEGE
jgi:uncharacterized protein YxjI